VDLHQAQEAVTNVNWTVVLSYVVPTITFLVGYYFGRKSSVAIGLHAVAKAIKYFADSNQKET
jgi:hypothetical protein